MTRRLLIPLLAAGLLAGCGRGSVRLETRTFALRYLSSVEAKQIVRPYVFEDRPGAKGVMSGSENSLTVRETADNLQRIGRVLAQYDRPQPRVRLTFQLIRADGASPPDPGIADVEAALRSLFRFRGYALVSQAVVTAVDQSGTEQVLSGLGGPYRLATGIQRVSGAGDSATVTLHVELDVPRSGGRFQTTVGIPVGKTAVLGNVAGGTPNTALILTVRPDLVKS